MEVRQFPKTKKCKAQKLKNLKPTLEDRCVYCGSPFSATHECFGASNRMNSMKYHLQVRLCLKCHQDVHAHPLSGRDLQLKIEYQGKFIEQYGYDKWMKIFGRDYANSNQ